MSHVSSSALAAFISSGACDAQFEAHVDSCAACASRLSAEARVAVQAGSRTWWSKLILGDAPLRSPIAALAPVMALCAVLAVLLSPLKGSTSPTQVSSPNTDTLSADAGGVLFTVPVSAWDERPADGGAR